MIAILAIMGARFMAHQILIGLVMGAVLILASGRIIRHVPDLERDPPTEKQ
jgi:NhaP-type Na+/H+ or K+/H+ antiporter